MIPDSFIQELLARVDVVDVVGRYVQLRKGGANLIGLCPFHNEKSPSFTVSPSKQFYHCFGCGAHGSAISFLMAHTGANFPEAVRSLASEVGLTVPESDRSPRQRIADQQRKEQRSQHQQILDAAQEHYLRQLKQHKPAQEYLKGRGLTGQTALRFGLGWSNADRRDLARVYPNYEEPLLVESGLVIEAEDGRRYDRFRARIMFPIRNRKGDVIAFGGRLIAPGEPKYLNSPETPLFSKSHELYGLWENRQGIRQEGFVTVVEGYMDVVALSQQGLNNAVATLGTATTEHHIRHLMRASDRIIFCFDGDKAGRRAAWRALTTCLPQLRDDVSMRFLFLPPEHDPDSYVREFGADAFRDEAKQSAALSTFMLDELSARHNLDEAEGRAACVHEALPLLSTLPDCTLSTQIEQEFAQLVRLTIDELQLRVLQSQASSATRREEPAFIAAVTPSDTAASPATVTQSSSRPRRATSQRSRSTSSLGSKSRTVTPIAKRLLTLLASQPSLAQSVSHEALEIIVQSPTLVLVHELMVVIHETQAQHIAALLQAVEPDSELAHVLHGVTAELIKDDENLKLQAEWDGALRRVEIDVIKHEQSALVAAGLPDAASRQRYQDLSRRLAQLLTAPSV